MRIVYILIGLILLPFVWVFERLGWIKPSLPLPKKIQQLVTHLEKNGLMSSVQVQPHQVNHAENVVTLKYGLNPNKFHVVTVTSSADEAAAQLLEAEACGAPQFTGVRRNGTLVMACTFSPPDTELEGRVTSAFMSYKDDA